MLGPRRLARSQNPSTRLLSPLIHWKGEPGKTYDLALMDEMRPSAKPVQVTKAVPPIDFQTAFGTKGFTLEQGGLNRLRLSEKGQPLTTSEYTFHVLDPASTSIPSDSARQLSDVYRILRTEPVCLGDALSALNTLPPRLANSQLALRLQLFIFWKLGYREEYDVVLAKLTKTSPAR